MYIDHMQIAFVCNQNLARSQVLAQYFVRHLPGHTVSSYGMIAQEGTRLPGVVNLILEEWGLYNDSLSAKNMFQHWNDLVKCDLILAMTSFIAETLISSGFTGRVINIESESERFGIQLHDPQLMPRKRCSFELAKYLFVSQAAMQGVAIRKSGNSVNAIIPESEDSLDAAVSVALADKGADAIILYADFVAPQKNLFSNSNVELSECSYSDRLDSFILNDLGANPVVVIPKHAELEPSKLYLSRSWFDFKARFLGHDLILITPPLTSGSTFLHESFLAAMGADEVQIVS